jgi:hypothetical protein
MTRPGDKQPGIILCAHCASYEAKVACRGCRLLVCGSCALRGCTEEAHPRTGGPLPRSWIDGVSIDREAGTIECDGEKAPVEAVLEVIVESQQFAGWGDLNYEYRVRLVLGDRQGDFFAVRIRSRNPMKDLDDLVVARGEQLARMLGVKLRVERGG